MAGSRSCSPYVYRVMAGVPEAIKGNRVPSLRAWVKGVTQCVAEHVEDEHHAHDERLRHGDRCLHDDGLSVPDNEFLSPGNCLPAPGCRFLPHDDGLLSLGKDIRPLLLSFPALSLSYEGP